MPDERRVRQVRHAVFAAGLLPLAWLVYLAFTDGLGADPVEFVRRATGTWTLDFLAGALAITPFRRLSGWHWLVRLRRTLGLYAFFYATLHVVTYLWLDQLFDVAEIVKDIAKRPLIAAGVVSYVLLMPLALTSTNAMVRRLGSRRWKQLHRLVYAAAVAGLLHFWWLVKLDYTRPLVYTVVIGVLLAARIPFAVGTNRQSSWK